MTKQDIFEKLTKKFPKSKIEIIDMTGQSNHFSLFILSDSFDNMLLIDRHKLIYSIFSKELTTEIHALQIKAYTPSEWVRKHLHLVKPNSSVLDLACGTGRHAILMHNLGHKVTAVDINVHYIYRLQDPTIEVIECDLEIK